MRAIRRANTKPEIALRSALHRQGYRFRKDLRLDLETGARVRPDIAFTGRRVAVFVDGCFWHACPDHGHHPAVNDWYWFPKLRRTVERDRAADAALMAAGWQVVRIWEHVPIADALLAVAAALSGRTGAEVQAGSQGTPGQAAKQAGRLVRPPGRAVPASHTRAARAPRRRPL
jgi:DNA mismatch endonuclease, patch repair protein